MSDSLRPHALSSPWNSPDQSTGVGILSLLQVIFPTQGSNPGLLHCRRIPGLKRSSGEGHPLLKLLSIESVISSSYLIFCCPLLFLPSIFPSIRVFSNDLRLLIRWTKCSSFSFNISPSNEYLESLPKSSKERRGIKSSRRKFCSSL